MRNILPHNVHSQQEGKGEALRVLPTGTAISSLVDALPSSHADRNTAEQCQNMKDDAMLCEVLDVNESSQNSAGHSVLDVSSGLSRVLNARSSSSGSGFELQSVPSQSQMCGSGFMDVRTMLSSQVQDISCEFDNSHGHVPAQQYKKSSKPSQTNNVSVMEPGIPLSSFTVLSLPEMSTSLPKETSEQARQSHRDASEPSIPNRKSTSIQPQEDKSGVEPMDDLAREPAPTCSSNISTFHMSNEKKVLIVQRQENDSNAQSCSNLSQKKHQTTLRDGKPSFPAADTYQGNSDSLSFASPGVLPSGPSHSRDVKPGRRKIRNKKKDVSCVGMDPMPNRNNVKECSSSTSVPSCFALPYGNRHSVSQNEASPILSYSALSQPSARRNPTQPETLPPLVTPMNPIRAYYQGIPLGYSVLPHPQVPDAAAIHSSPLQGSAANAALPFSFWNILSTTVPHHSPSPSIYAAPSPFPITITERPGASCLNLVQQGNSQQHDETASRSLPGPYYSPGAGFFPMSSCPSQTAPYVYQLALSPPSNACPSALSSNAPTHCSNGMYMYSVHAPESFSSSHPLRTPILISPSSVPLQPTSTSGAMNTLESSLLSESVKSSHHPVYRNLSSSEVQHSLDSAYPAQYTQPCHTPALTLEAQAETTTSSFASVYLQGNSTQPYRVSGPTVSSGPSLNSTQPPVFAISDERVSSRLIHEDTEVAVRWSQHPPREVCLQTSNLSNPHKETMTQNNGLSVGSSPLNLQEASTLAATIAAPPSVVAAEDWLRMFQNYRMKNSHGQCELQAHITELAVDQLRSRLLLDVLTCTNDTKRVTEAWHESEVCHLLITTIFEVSAKLRIDSVGYMVLCVAIQKADNKQRAEFYTMHIQGQVVALTLNAYGCRVVQTCMETLEESQRIALAQELNGHILTCIYNQNGNHVIQRCIQLLPFEACISIIDCVIAGAFELSTHMCGCRVVQRVLESSPPTVVTSIVSQLLPKLLYLVHDRYGNYVIQHLLVQSGNSSHKKVFLNDLIPQCYGLSLHKIASNVVEKMFLCASKEDRDAMITVFVTTKRRGKAKVGDAKRLLAMIQDSFGNYVIQKVMDHASASQFQRIAQHLRQLSPYLHQNLHGKHILDRVAKNPAVHECTGALEG